VVGLGWFGGFWGLIREKIMGSGRETDNWVLGPSKGTGVWPCSTKGGGGSCI